MKVRGLFNGVCRVMTLLSGGLAIALLVLGVRSFWRYDEVGYFTYQPNPQPRGRDCRSIVASHRGAVFLVRLESDLPPDVPRGSGRGTDWYGGEPTELIVSSGPWDSLPFNGVSMSFKTLTHWVTFNFDSARATRPLGDQQWKWRAVVVPDWFLFLLLAFKPGLSLRRRWILLRRRRTGVCLACGYDQRGNGSGICSECGQSLPIHGPIAAGRRSPRRRRAVAALVVVVCGIAGICWILHGRFRAEKFVRIAPGTALSDEGAPARIELEVSPGVSMRFCYIPSGTFLMGSLTDEEKREKEEVQHKVSLTKPFYMSRNLVSQDQYAAVMGEHLNHFSGVNLPVESVDWDDATEFCRRLSARTGRKIRLPTEAQWEYACRAGTTTPFNTGGKLRRDWANYSFTSFPGNRRITSADRATVPVGSFKPNAWGLYDMHGNLSQWCSDWYGAYPAGDAIDPRGADTGAAHVIRGGSWYFNPGECRAASRYWILPGNRAYDVGFRVCLDL